MSLFEEALKLEVVSVAEMLSDKNRRYGNSALDPVRIFSKADWREQINVRMDDKLSRLRSAQEDDVEDAKLDLLGYLLLERIGLRIRQMEEELVRRWGDEEDEGSEGE